MVIRALVGYILLLSLRLPIEIALSLHQLFKPFFDWIFINSFVQNNIVSFIDNATDGGAVRLEKMTRVKQVVDDVESLCTRHSGWIDTETNVSV